MFTSTIALLITASLTVRHKPYTCRKCGSKENISSVWTKCSDKFYSPCNHGLSGYDLKTITYYKVEDRCYICGAHYTYRKPFTEKRNHLNNNNISTKN